jgi:uncharacterized protein (TIGR03437 family)
MHAPSLNGSGVFLNPIGIVNAASYQPVTASLAPGELIELNGTGLASTNMTMQGGQAFPTTLGGVQVMINGIACPLYFVSPTLLAAIVPYEVASNNADGGYANIQVFNNKVASNVVQMYLTDAEPASFAQNQEGFGFAAALHAATNQPVTESNPAVGGEYISVYMTGIGTVTPTISDGAVGPSGPLSYSDLFNAGSLEINFIDYNLGNLEPGNIQYAGLVPTLAGLYQINVQVPTSGLGAGDDVYIEFVTDAADVNQIQIPLGFGGLARTGSAPMSRMKRIQAKRAHPQSAAKRRPRAAAPAAVPQL